MAGIGCALINSSEQADYSSAKSTFGANGDRLSHPSIPSKFNFLLCSTQLRVASQFRLVQPTLVDLPIHLPALNH